MRLLCITKGIPNYCKNNDFFFVIKNLLNLQTKRQKNKTNTFICLGFSILT